MYVKHTLHGQFSGLQLLILAENSSRLMVFLISKGTILHTFPAKYFSDFKPQATVFTEWSEKSVCERRLQFKLHSSNNSNITGDDILFLTLNISIANEQIFL